MNYTTQMDAARKGMITPEMKIVAAKENLDIELLREKMALGEVIIPCNKVHHALCPQWNRSYVKNKNQCEFRNFERFS